MLVLPAPLGPRRASTSPRWARNERPVDGQRGAVADDQAVALDGRTRPAPVAGPRRRRRAGSVGVVHGSSRYRCADMIDIRLVRDDIDAVKAALARRGVDPAEVDRLAALDAGARTAVGHPGRGAGQGQGAVQAGGRGPQGRRRRPGRGAGRREPGRGRRGARAQHAGRGRPGGGPPGPPLPAQPAGRRRPRRRRPRRQRRGPQLARGRRPPTRDAQRVPHWEIGAELGLLDMERGGQAVRVDVPPLPGLRRPAAPGPHLLRPRQPRRRVRGDPARRPWC